MKENWHIAYDTILKSEGYHDGKRGWMNDPADSGGPTLAGITYNEFCAFKKLPQAKNRDWDPEVVDQLRAISDADIEAYYRARKWHAIRGDDLPAGVDVCVADSATLHGPRQAILFLQRALGRQDTGKLVQADVDAAQAAADLDALVESICNQRRKFYDNLIARRPKDAKWRKGWFNRTARLEAQCLELAPDMNGSELLTDHGRPDAEVTSLDTAEVAQLQKRLNDLRYTLGTPDGNMDTAARAAVFEFQDANGIPATGNLDQETIAAIRAPDAKPLPVPPERQNITAEQLLERGSTEIAEAKQEQQAAHVGGAATGLLLLDTVAGIDAASAAADKANGLLAKFGLSLVSIPPKAWFAVGLSSVALWFYGRSKRREERRVQKARTGLDLSR